MTKKSFDRKHRDAHSIPKREDVAAINFDRENNRFMFLKKNMLENQLYRDGPRIARSFDKIAKSHIKEVSAIFAATQGMILRHLPRLDDDGYRATSARLLASAANSFIASIEVARHGYRRQFGMISRSLIETLATTVVLKIRPDAVEEFHNGKLPSTNCVGWAKPVFPPIGQYYGMLNGFVHIGREHSMLEMPTLYKDDDAALPFILGMIRGNVWTMFVLTEFVFHDEVDDLRFWRVVDENALAYDPSEETQAWSNEFLDPVGLRD
ncbi:hypothetical protein NHF48_019810 [Sphingomonas sp. H160509]|uniref:hypothetical protein n=1 Tax=Sphingomonas sp. H160509 TaxID=2955313 RepID=UPI0020974DB0|nr:hypothetical protein [Sphingomonas sp. H160509]MDD1452665.1 hypothetical protein [Sphingomonas sp. H160509]